MTGPGGTEGDLDASLSSPPQEIIGDAGQEASERQRLRGASVNGVVINLVSQLARFGMRFAYQIVIARLLLPGDFGLVALTAPVITFVQLFADLGLSQATVQQKDIDQEQLSFLFWVSVAAGLALAVLCVAAAPLVAAFYGDPRAAGVMVVSGSLLLVSGLYSQHLALLNRHMRFRALALLDLASFALGAAAGIASALLGAGYWAILVNQAVVSVSALIIAWVVSGWVPGRPGPYSRMKPLLHFGGNITGFNFVNFFSRNTDDILLGRFAGEHALGLYDRAFKLMLLPFSQISGPFTKVALPLLSRSQDEPEFYRRAYQRMLGAVLLMIYPGLVFMIATSHDLIVLALGERWAEVAPIFAILGIDAFVAPVGNSMGWLFVSQGRTREMRNWGVVTSVLFVCCFAIGLHWGPRGVAAGYAAAGLIEISFLTRVVTRKGALRGRDFWPVVLPFVLGIGITFAAMHGLRAVLPHNPWSLLVEACAAYAVFVASLTALPSGREILRDVAAQTTRLGQKMTGLLRQRRRTAQAAPVP